MAGHRTILLTVGLIATAAFMPALVPSPTAAGTQPLNGQSTGRVWASISTGGWHTCGIHRDHTLWCWGYNETGALGVGDTADRYVPTLVGSDTDWVRVSAGY